MDPTATNFEILLADKLMMVHLFKGRIRFEMEEMYRVREKENHLCEAKRFGDWVKDRGADKETRNVEERLNEWKKKRNEFREV